MHFNLLTLFPDMFPAFLGESLSGKALSRGDWSYNTINIRDFGHGTHKAVDDTPYGGGAGMVMRADVIEDALLSIPKNQQTNKRIYMSPRGKPLTQARAIELSQTPQITILCGRYEGVDERILRAYNFEEISIGDYVLSGGEPAALILMDACIRLLPGVMGNKNTADEESFSPARGGLLEYPHYTRPASWIDKNGHTHNVPQVLQNGNHAKINAWRDEQALSITKTIRPDLINKSD